MSDSRRRSSRSSSTSHHRSSGASETASNVSASSSSSRHRSSRHSSSSASSTAPSNRSSTSLHRISGSALNRSRESLAPPSTPAARSSSSSRSSSHRHSSNSASNSASYDNPPATDPGPAAAGLGSIYGSLGGRASESRFSLTDQFASTRSVLDFGFDDSASSIFDAQSIFSVGTAQAPSLYGYEAAAAAAAAATASGGVLDPFADLGSITPLAGTGGGSLQGSPWQPEEEYLGGAYSTVLEENDDDDDTATVSGRNDGNDDDNTSLTDDNTPDSTPTKARRRSRAPSSADVTVIGGGGGGDGVNGSRSSQRSPPHGTEAVDELQDPLQLPVPVLPPSQKGLWQSYSAAPAAPPVRAPVAPVHRTYYDLFCLSREQFPPPSSAQIRAAYYRLFRLLNSSISNGGGGSGSTAGSTNLMPAALRPYAAAYFLEIQVAFETLIDPIRRLEYDRFLDDLEDERAENDVYGDESDSEADDSKPGKAGRAASTSKKADKTSTPAAYPLPQGTAFVRKHDFQTTTDLGARYTVSDVRLGNLLLPKSLSISSLDYALTQTMRVGLPAFRQYTELSLYQLQCRVQRVRRLLHERFGIGRGGAVQNSFKSRDGRTYYYTRQPSSSAAPNQPLWPIRCGIPIVSLSASAYTLSTAAAAAGAVLPLGDRYQPLLPEVLGPARIAQLAHTRASGCVVLGYRQEFWTGSNAVSGLPSAPSVVAEIETQVLPRVAVTARLSQSVSLPSAVRKLERKVLGSQAGEPVHVEVMMQTAESSLFSSSLPLSPSLPRFGLGLSRRMGGNGGSMFLCTDSGNNWWSLLSPFASSSSSSLPVSSSLFAPLIPPMVEVGYSMSPHELGLHVGRPLTGPADRGLKGVDVDMDTLGNVAAYSSDRRNPVQPHGTWTVSAATTGYGSMAAYVRYGRTVFLTPLGRRAPAIAAANTRQGRCQSQSPRRAVRVEAELCAADRYLSDGYLAVRALAPVRWWGFRNGWFSNATALFRSSTPASTTPPKLGLEVALSAGSGSVHFSLYWSRLGQRIKLPFLLLPNPASSGTTSTAVATKLFVWAAIAPMAFMAVREVARAYWHSTARRWKTSRAKTRAKKRGLSAAAAAAAAQAEVEQARNDADAAGLIDGEEEEEQAINRHRAEADELTMILASAVDAQHVLARQLRKASKASASTNNNNNNKDDYHLLDSENGRPNELVILSAKYGVALADDPDDPDDPDSGHARHDSATSGLGHSSLSLNPGSPPMTAAMASRNGWAPDYEVADVTAAVSALIVAGGSGIDGIDSDYLLIPAGLQKSRLLGFWDPAPNYRLKQRVERRARGKKVLHVRYMWNGLERIAEVGDREELRLP
ncbi:hypothetical protein SCUCBS95973_004585 [Sporothrix curviconia]|uniref:J domain-containing protein n=1 Tax=Sporothrix curviconia TaxID=1260050 RepID=A0ABP0BRG2_9PEZI